MGIHLQTNVRKTEHKDDSLPLSMFFRAVYDNEAWRVADEFYIDPNIFLFSDKDELQQ